MFRPAYYISLPLVFQIFNILQQCSHTLCLTIDNRLTPTGNDCFTRISIGSKLPEMDIASRTNAMSLTECEKNCLGKKHDCNAFSFGVGVKGNSTCLISRQIPVLENLETDQEYDVYAKKRRDSIWCDFDRFYKSFVREDENRSTKANKLISKESIINNDNPFSKLIPEPISVLVPHNTLTSSRNKNGMTNHGHIGNYGLLVNHDQRFLSEDNNRSVLDIIGNKNKKTSPTPFVIICHRKLLPGKKMMGLFIERIVNCENLQDCCRACDYEKTFVCKGFNHRRRTDDSKCTCELTSTPYFRMDTDEDFSIDSYYDYYEKVDNCPSSAWHDNGIPRWKSYVKSSRENSQNAWLDRENANKDFVHTDHSIYKENYPLYRESAYDLSNGLARSGKPFHYEQPHGFTSRYHDLNWNRNWKESESRNPDVINDNTFVNSRIDYDKGYFDAKSPRFPNSRLDHPLTQEYSIPNENEQFYGKLYNYGSAFGYNDNYVSVPKEPYYEKHETSQMTRKCSVKAASGSKLSRSVLRKTCAAHDFEQCEEFCTNETSFSCESFAYRCNVATTNPTDNCLLSDRSYQDLNFYTDLEPNRDYDTYVLTSDAKNCYLKKSTNRYPLEECFSRIRSGFTMPMDVMKKSIFVNDFGECQFACTTSQEFVCRSFVFKYAMDNHKAYSHERVSPNCFLSDWPAEEINPIDMPDMDGAELYERNTLSYGCETHPSSLSNSNAITPYDKGSSQSHMDELCYSEYHRPCKLMSHAVISSMRAVTKQDCRRRCSTMRNAGVVPCMSFNYIITIDNTRSNCFLSDISIRDLRPNLDYVHDNDHTLYTWKDFDPYCGLIANAFNTTNAPTFENHDQSHPPEFGYPNAQRTPESEIHHPREPASYHPTRWRNKFRPDEHDYKHKLASGDNTSPLEPGAFEYGLNFFHSANQLPPSRRYTVNGSPCKNGTVCQRNEITGFWSCEIENEYGNWDYCCEPSHHCGFSQGYHHPWCYVGPNEDQWRPCSETYYPYHFAMDHSSYRQSPLYTARHWPVIYFHETSPPNCSTNNPNVKESWKLQ